MKISTKGRYGLRIMIDLAVHGKQGPVSAETLASRQEISRLYLEQVLHMLKKADLIRSIKGPRGGYMLKASPSSLSLGTILRVLEGGLAVVEEPLRQDGDRQIQKCIKVHVWDVINKGVDDLVDDTTLETLVDGIESQNQPDPIACYI